MRYVLTFLIILTCAVSLPAQAPDISEIEPRDLDPELLDVSDAAFFFQGPVQVYVENLKYGNYTYAAVLDYDGGQSIEVYAPDAYGAGIRPESIDLSRTRVQLNSNGTITLSDAVIDGSRYSATIAYSGGRTLTATGQVRRLGPGPEARNVARLQQQLSDARSEISQRDERIEELRSGNTDVAQLQEQLSDARSEISQRDERIEELRGGNTTVAQLQDRLNERNQRVETLETRVGALETRVQQLQNPELPRLSRQLHSGFDGQNTSFGQWARPGRSLEQTDAEAKFAKMVFPVRQSGTEFTYSVAATAPDTGWVGYGIHFLADDAQTAEGYGYGDSYLLWVTRDPRNQTNRSFVQLYRSDNDVRMIQVASAILPTSSFDQLETTVYVNTAEREIQVFLEGQYAFTFPAEDLKNLAPEVALRALGSITFTDLSVRGR